jgi:hypothetical protein
MDRGDELGTDEADPNRLHWERFSGGDVPTLYGTRPGPSREASGLAGARKLVPVFFWRTGGSSGKVCAPLLDRGGERARKEVEMLTPSQLKPYILHEDYWVRLAVMDYFGDIRSRDPEVAGLMLAAHERHWRKGEFPLLPWLDKVLLDDAAAERILALLATTESHITTIQLNQAVAALPIPFLRREHERVEAHPRVIEETRAQIRLRLELAGLSDEDLWRRFLDFSGRDRMQRNPARAGLGEPNALTEAVAARRAPGDEAILEMLRSPTYDGTWFQLLLMKLAGDRGLKGAVPYLVSRIDREEDDFRPSFDTTALVRIGDPATVRLIRDRWPRYWGSARSSATDVLWGIKEPESEEALLAFFAEEERPHVRFFIAEGLCKLFSREGIGPVLEAIRDGDGSDYNEPLERKLLPVLDVLGVELAEADAWRRARAEDHARHPLRDDPSPEAEEIHRKILESVEARYHSDEEIHRIYGELGRSFAEEEEE